MTTPTPLAPEELPELPRPAIAEVWFSYEGWNDWDFDGLASLEEDGNNTRTSFTAGQMKSYARAAILADRAARQEAVPAGADEAQVRALNAALTYRNHDPEAMDEQDAWVALIDAIGALSSHPAPQQAPEPGPHRCIKPQCPVDCCGCNHAIPPSDTARILIADLLNAFAVDGFGSPLEDEESTLVDRARKYLCADPAQTVADAGSWEAKILGEWTRTQYPDDMKAKGYEVRSTLGTPPQAVESETAIWCKHCGESTVPGFCRLRKSREIMPMDCVVARAAQATGKEGE